MVVLDCGLLSFCFHRNNEAGQTYRREGWHRQSFLSSSQLLSPFPFTCTRGRRSLRSIVIRIFHTPTRSVSHTHTHTYILFELYDALTFVSSFHFGCSLFLRRRVCDFSSSTNIRHFIPFWFFWLNISNCLRELINVMI